MLSKCAHALMSAFARNGDASVNAPKEVNGRRGMGWSEDKGAVS